MLQNLAVWATLGLLLGTVGLNWDTWQFWAFIGLFWSVEQLGKRQGQVQGIINYIDMSEQEQERVRRALNDARSN